MPRKDDLDGALSDDTPFAVVPAGSPVGFFDTIAPPATPAAPRAEPARLAPGVRVRQYELIRELGRGGMGVVYVARDLKLGRRVAMKFLLDATREVAERFLVEARATASCSHDNIVVIHEVGEYDRTPYMVFELLEGQTLRELMSRTAPSRVVELALPIARALARAHAVDIVHRDLKPENVIVTDTGQVKVLDFGIAKARGAPTVDATTLRPATDGNLHITRDGATVGTLPYMSPEQLGADDVDHRSDLWALGIMMFELLAGRHPVDPLTESALLASAVLVDEPVISVAELRADVPEQLALLVDQCLRKRKAERPASAADVVARLERMLPGRSGRQLAEGESPYPGLTAFQEADADRFFGRGRDVARMVVRVHELALTGVVGPSGVGKSSFVRAGVVPALKATGEAWEAVTLRPGRQPIAALASIAERLARTGRREREPENAGKHDELVARLRVEPGLLGALLRQRAREVDKHILLFVDQLEELYTLVTDPGERAAFTAALSGVADDAASPLRVVVSMRSDFLDRVSEDPRFTDELARGLVFLAPPDRDGLREALVEPVEMVGYRFETAAMVGDMVDSLADVQGALPLLQFAAAKLWDTRDRDQRMLTVASYRAIGGLTGALASHADDVIAQLDATLRKLAPRVIRALVTPERTRAIVELADLRALGDPDDVARLVDRLVAARLLVAQTRGDGAGGSVELVHESLIDRWPALRRWLDEDEEDTAYVAQLSAAAKQWDARGRPAGLLWRGDAMEEARRWSALRPRELAVRDREFLDAVLALAQRGKRARRAMLVAAFGALAAIAAGAIVALLLIRGAEQRARDSARLATDEAAKAKQALEEQLAAQRDKAAAEASKAAALVQQQQAERAVQEKTVQVEESREQLKAKNAELEATLKDAKAARERAEKASASAATAAAEAQKASAQLEQALARERARVKELENEKRKLSTDLK